MAVPYELPAFCNALALEMGRANADLETAVARAADSSTERALNVVRAWSDRIARGDEDMREVGKIWADSCRNGRIWFDGDLDRLFADISSSLASRLR